jgi:hypothetical protein
MKEETVKQFVSLRSRGHKSIFFLELEGRDFLVRPLTYSEYGLVLDLEDSLDGPVINDTIVRMASLYIERTTVDTWLEEAMPSSPDSLAEVIIKNSGFQDEEIFIKTLEEKRKSATEFQSIIQMYICSVFKVTPNEVLNMTMVEQLDLFAKAEHMLGKPVEIGEMISGSQRPTGPPVPDGMESVEFDTPDWNRIQKGDRNIM